ncbi:hypothetical protein QMZ05_13935 [Bradyrhizobium sp. INPA03-11B]|uniref:hypothetical protein n=1 Tax=Bradyrhizobium sp. INPA03-11B TaxID=418598 RepID=UPI00338FEDCB
MKIFWAWQFDLPGKIARHFIRGALEAAAAQINQTEEIDEPDEDFQGGKLQLDYGRKNLKGSPDLAIEILKKIDGAAVFVGDVTPVGKGVPHRTDEGVESDGKLLMNPNVAIELGYALKSKGTDHVLMVMNSHYGKRADMPFDLGGKGGPIMYNLAPTATGKEIETEKKKLVAVLVEALKEYVPKPVAVSFEGLKPKIGRGIFFSEGEVLAEDKGWPGKEARYVMPFRKVLWLKLSPTTALPHPLAIDLLTDNIGRFGPFTLPQGLESVRQNKYGVCFFSPAGATHNIDAIAQYTRDGEIWGVNADYIRQGEFGQQQAILTLPIENILITELDAYLRFMRDVSKVPLPIRVEVGIEGIAGRQIAHNGYPLNRSSPIMHKDFVEHNGTLRSFDKAEQDAFLMQFFNKLNENSGIPRPKGLYGRG